MNFAAPTTIPGTTPERETRLVQNPDQFLGSASGSVPETMPLPPDRAGMIEDITKEPGVDLRSADGAAAIRRELEELIGIVDLMQKAD